MKLLWCEGRFYVFVALFHAIVGLAPQLVEEVHHHVIRLEDILMIGVRCLLGLHSLILVPRPAIVRAIILRLLGLDVVWVDVLRHELVDGVDGSVVLGTGLLGVSFLVLRAGIVFVVGHWSWV